MITAPPRTTFIFLPGIHHNPSRQDGWTDRAVEWVHDNMRGARAEKFEYFASFALRRLRQQSRAAELKRLLDRRAGRRVILVAHSNGADIACRAICLGAAAHTLHLVAPACERDFDRNGINAAISSGRLSSCVVWISGRDGAMRLARISNRLLSWIGLGYGTLGIDGPSNQWRRVRVIHKRNFNHNSYFDAENFDRFMRELVSL